MGCSVTPKCSTRTAETVLAAGKPQQVLVGIRVQVIRDLGYKVVRDPEPDNGAHCLIFPYPENRTHRKAMATASVPVKLESQQKPT